jgi:5-(carboxyamino)imidazole ribonucleotide mutase
MLAPQHDAIRAALDAFRARQTQDVLDHADPRQP